MENCTVKALNGALCHCGLPISMDTLFDMLRMLWDVRDADGAMLKGLLGMLFEPQVEGLDVWAKMVLSVNLKAEVSKDWFSRLLGGDLKYLRDVAKFWTGLNMDADIPEDMQFSCLQTLMHILRSDDHEIYFSNLSWTPGTWSHAV